ncbi:MAG: type II secretion system F family protein [Gammaproteobacteria bacterium]|nr:type II secretion system F family protein [Gammaproteobacteria bacterium]
MAHHFKYTGYDDHGNKLENTIVAANYEEAHNEATKRVSVLIELLELNASTLGVLPEKLRLPLEEKALFFKELALLLDSGIILSKALTLLGQSLSDYPKLTSAVQLIVRDLEEGKSFSEALSKFPKTFDEIAIGLVTVSEHTGNMASTLTDLADYYHFNLENKRKVVQSLTYPSVVFAVSLLAIYIILDFVLPNMTSIFKSSEDIPVYTQVLLSVSSGFQAYKIWLLAGTFAVVVALYFDAKTHGQDANVVKFLVRFPMVKNLLSRFELIRFHATMQVMLAAGIQINEALKLAQKVVLTPSFRKQLQKVTDDIAEGTSFSNALARTSSLNALSIGLIEIAEQTGNLESVFAKLADREKLELNTRLERFIALLEPLLIVFLGGFIGSVVVVMILSIMSTQNVAL